MSGRMADVPGLSPQAVILSAATGEAYGDTPADRVDLLRSWVATDNCTEEEVALALDTARLYLLEDPSDTEMAQAVVVLARVLRVVG